MEHMDTNDTHFYEAKANPIDIVIPPTCVLCFILIGILFLSLFTQTLWWKSRLRKPNIESMTKEQCLNIGLQNTGSHMETDNDEAEMDNNVMFSEMDVRTIVDFCMFQNNPVALLKMCVPVIVSVVFCPVTILIHPMIYDFFYPMVESRKDINEAIAVFLLPAGLVYAMVFGYALQDALVKFRDTSTDSCRHLTLLIQINHLIRSCSVLSKQQQLDSMKALSRSTVQWMKRLMEDQYRVTAKIESNIWSIVDKLRVCKHESAIDKKTMTTLYDKVIELDILMAEGYRSSRAKINIMLWIFMELLGFIAFFGILFIKAYSYRMELTMCMMTVFTVSAFLHILADLDTAFHGTFIVDLSVFISFLQNLSEEYEAHKGAHNHLKQQI